MYQKTLLLLTAAMAFSVIGCDYGGQTVVTIKVNQGINRRAEAMMIDGTQIGHFDENVARRNDFLVEQEITVNTPVKIVLVPLSEHEGTKMPESSADNLNEMAPSGSLPETSTNPKTPN